MSLESSDNERLSTTNEITTPINNENTKCF